MGDIERIDTATIVIIRSKKKRHLSNEHKDKIRTSKAGKPRATSVTQSISNTLKAKYQNGELTVPKHNPKCTPEQIAEMKQAYLMGTPVSILQQKYQLSRTTIYKYIKDCR